MTAFYVSTVSSEQPWYRRLRMPLALAAHEEEILKDMTALAERIGVRLAISATAQSVVDKAFDTAAFIKRTTGDRVSYLVANSQARLLPYYEGALLKVASLGSPGVTIYTQACPGFAQSVAAYTLDLPRLAGRLACR